ncbi:MAG: AI-2E family transporter [bacterium]|nr:AI-2E family transporter [bacterium]
MVFMTDNQPTVQRWDFDRVFRMTLVVAGAAGLVWLLRFLADVLIPFAVALLLAYLLNPIVTAVQARLGGRRGPAVGITVVGTFVVMIAALFTVVPLVTHEFAIFGEQIRQLGFVRGLEDGPPLAEQVQEGQESIAQAYQTFRDRQSEGVQQILDESIATLSENLSPERASELLANLAKRIAPGLLGLVSGMLSFLLGLTGIVVVVLYLIFILLDYERVSVRWRDLLPPSYKDPILLFVDEFSLAMRRYFRSQFVVAIIVGILFAVGFKLIGLRMGILLGLFVGALNMVPYLQVVGLIPALLLGVFRAMESGSSLVGPLLGVLLVFAIVQIIQDGVIVPRIMGKATGLRPIVILLGVFVWGKLLGFLGLVLAIPLTCLGVAYYGRFVLGKLDAKVIEEE